MSKHNETKKRVIILHIGDKEGIEQESFESKILAHRQLEKDDGVDIQEFMLDDDKTFINEKNPENAEKEHKKIREALKKLRGGDKIFILAHGQPDAEKVGTSTHYTILGDYLSKGLKTESFTTNPLKISVHACRAGRGRDQGQHSFAGLLHHHLGRLNIKSEVTARTELVHIDEEKYTAPGGGILTITPTKHAFSIVLDKLGFKNIPTSWYRYKKPGTKVKFVWDKEGNQVKFDHYVSKYNENIFQQLDLLRKHYEGKHHTSHIMKIIENIEVNLYKENYFKVTEHITNLLSLMNDEQHVKTDQFNSIYENLLKYNQNILQKHANSFKKVLFKDKKFAEDLPRDYVNIKTSIINAMKPLDQAIANIARNMFPDKETFDKTAELFQEMRNDLYRHLRHKHLYPTMSKFSIKEAEKIIKEVADVTNAVLNKNNQDVFVDGLKAKQEAVEKFISNNSRYLESSKLLLIKYIFAGLKEGIKDAISQGGKETIVNIFRFSVDMAKLRYSYFPSYKEQLTKLSKITKDVIELKKDDFTDIVSRKERKL